MGRLPGTPGIPLLDREVGPAVMQLEGVGVGDWPHLFQCALAVEDVDVGLHVSAAHLGLCVACSGLCGGTAGRGVFALRPIKQGAYVGPFWGAVVYAELGKKRVKTARYAASVLGSLGPSARDFSERAMQVVLDESDFSGGDSEDWAGSRRQRPAPHVLRRGDGRQQRRAAERGRTPPVEPPPHEAVFGDSAFSSMFVVPSPLCVMEYINDGRPTSAIEVEAAVASASQASTPPAPGEEEEEGGDAGGSVAGGGHGRDSGPPADTGERRWTGHASPNVRI